MAILCTKTTAVIPPLAGAMGGEVSHVDDLTAADRLLASDQFETLVVIGSDVDLTEALNFTASQRLARPALGVVLLRERLEVTLLALAIRAGVREVVPESDLDLLAESCLRSRDLSRVTPAGVTIPAQGSTEGKIAVVFATKGGCGKTTTATKIGRASCRERWQM